MQTDWIERSEIKNADEETVKAQALEDPKVKEQTDGKTIRKIIFIPGRIFNIVAN